MIFQKTRDKIKLSIRFRSQHDFLIETSWKKCEKIIEMTFLGRDLRTKTGRSRTGIFWETQDRLEGHFLNIRLLDSVWVIPYDSYLSACWVFRAALLRVPVSRPSYGIFIPCFLIVFSLYDFLWILFMHSLLFLFYFFLCFWSFIWMNEVWGRGDLVVKFYNLTKIIIRYTKYKVIFWNSL